MNADRRLYARVDPKRAGGRDLAELASMLARGGATLVQLRDKVGSTQAMVESARAMRHKLAPLGVPLLINDRADVAFAAGADGVHLGQDDMAGAGARGPPGPPARLRGGHQKPRPAAPGPAQPLRHVLNRGRFAPRA